MIFVFQQFYNSITYHLPLSYFITLTSTYFFHFITSTCIFCFLKIKSIPFSNKKPKKNYLYIDIFIIFLSLYFNLWTLIPLSYLLTLNLDHKIDIQLSKIADFFIYTLGFQILSNKSNHFSLFRQFSSTS